ncbi:MAG: HNH endonuclease [Fibrobacter sp.]|uniref:HNH endonuclease n=1 Tax=Fibrobacter sp. TaxID=35828 RepID=UPI0025B985F2|nr:HNH endonuclease [Fibrobacter sp.]MBR4784235.1 HNH endonuclease [Fibrobacter sp.]
MRFNQKIVETILTKCKGLSLKKQVKREEGRFLADKSYGFDTMFFVSRFIQRYRFGNIYRRDKRELENEYIRDLFCLRDAAQVGNYFTEALALLRFVNAMKCDSPDVYEIVDNDVLDIYSSSFENAYIFHYLLVYSIFNEHDLWNNYLSFCSAPTLAAKQYQYESYRKKYAAIDARVKDPNALWSMFTPKYPIVVLNYANRMNMVTRTGNVTENIVSRTDIALNVQGSRANQELPKKNAYLDNMSESYIIETLRPYLAVKMPEYKQVDDYLDSFSISVADTKLDMLDAKQGIVRERKSQGELYKFVGGNKVRTVQGEFRNGLLQKTPHQCPICGFAYENFLIASHIKPYAKCDDTYDAMNPNNGLLMCPVCDKLFENSNYMTINPETGKVEYIEDIKNEKEFLYLHEKKIAYDYIDCERRHYLKWHYKNFKEKHNL